MIDTSDHITGKTGLTLTIKASKDGAAFATITPTVTELESGFYKLALTSSHTDTLGDFALHITASGADPTDLVDEVVVGLPGDVVQISGDATAADNLETMLDGTGGQTLSLGKLNIVNNAGDAIVASSTGSNGSGINASGNGSGDGIRATGGATGHGQSLIGGATSGDGLRSRAPTSGQGVHFIGNGTSPNHGHGIRTVAAGADGNGLYALGCAAGDGDGIGGWAPNGIGIGGWSTGGNGHGIAGVGNGSGTGMTLQGGATGRGVAASGGATSGHGVYIAGGPDSNALTLEADDPATGDAIALNAAINLGDGDWKIRASNLRPDNRSSGGVIADGSNSATTFKTNRTETDNDYWKDAFVRFTNGDLVDQVKKVTAYNGTTKFLTVSGGFTGAPADGDGFEIVND